MEIGSLMQVLHQLPEPDDPNLILGPHTSDDAGVYRIDEGRAMVVTVDFFPPIVDDPYLFGQIATANALSDVYAMGAVPLVATTIVCFPQELPVVVLSEILRGSCQKLKEAGAVIGGGHTINDKEIKYGLSVTGIVDPRRMITSSGAKPGDTLILTKPIGAGVVTTALRAGRISTEDAADTLDSMKTLNDVASRIMVEAGVNACTDVTGFGLLGHLYEMAVASGVAAIIEADNVAFFNHAATLVRKRRNRPASIQTNRKFLTPHVRFSEAVDEPTELLLHDPQTSGGLLLSVGEDRKERLLEGLHTEGIEARPVGIVVEKREGWTIEVR